MKNKLYTWNYQIIEHRFRGQSVFSLHEVYYSLEGVITEWSPPIDLAVSASDGPEAIIAELKKVLHDIKKYPVLVLHKGDVKPRERRAKNK